MSPRARGLWIALALAALTIGAFLLRTTGARCLVPHMVEVHERVYATQVARLRAETPHPETERDFGYYPLLVAGLALLTQPDTIAEPRTLDEHLEACGADIVHLRRLVALLAALGVPATYFLARRFLPLGASFAAAAFVAASPLSISFAQQARPHAVVTGAVVAAVLGALLVLRRPRLGSYVLAGLALGLALAVLHNGIAALPALVVAHGLRAPGHSRARAWVGFGAALAIALGTFALFYPRTLAAELGAPGAELRVEGDRADLSGHDVFLARFNGGGFRILGHALVDYEPWLAVLAATGVLTWLASRLRARGGFGVGGSEEFAVVSCWCVPYLAVIGVYEITYERFLLPLVPVLACAAAFALERARQRCATRAPRLGWLALLLPVLLQVGLGWRLARAYGATDTPTQTARWIAGHVPPGSARVALMNTLDVPLLRTDSSLRETPRMLKDVTRRWLGYQARLDPPVLLEERRDIVAVPRGTKDEIELFTQDVDACIDTWHADYVIVEVYSAARRAPLARLRAALRSRGELVARFSPHDDPDDDEVFMYAHLGSPGYGWWTRHLLSAVAFGPVIEVYRLRRP